MLNKLILGGSIFFFSFHSISQDQEILQKKESDNWHCADYAFQYQVIVKSRMHPNFPGDLCDIIRQNQKEDQKVIIALGTMVDLVIFPKNKMVDQTINEVGYANN